MIKQLRPAIVSVIVLTVLTGFIFPGVIMAIASVAFPRQAKGSLIERTAR